jgi:sphinganine-1-phosphate aldolase
MKLPSKGLDQTEVFEKLKSFSANDLDWRSGKIFGYVFDPGKKIMEVGKKAYSMFLTENGLDFSSFPSLLNLEKNLVSMGATHLGGDAEVAGNFTSGGTESILLAVKTARDHYRKIRPEIKLPEMILPTTAHAAFHKAAHYFDVQVVPVPVDDNTFRVDPDKVAKAVTHNTILLVGSAPSYAHGVVDPIEELGQIALKNNLLLHVDACMGGFLLPYLKRLGEAIPTFDFSVDGVTSISMDLHKYAYCPKGASLVLYRNRELRKSQIFAFSRWTGYTMVNMAIQSSKSGGPMAAAWAVLNYVGDAGYLEIARKKLAATRKIIAGIAAIPQLKLLSKPHMCLVAFTSETIDVFKLIDEINNRGWYVQPALSYANSPANIHLSINTNNVGREEAFLKDLRECVKITTAAPPRAEGLNQLAAELSALDASTMTDDQFAELLEMAGIGGDALPKQMADINTLLNGLPAEFRERLLLEYVNQLF